MYSKKLNVPKVIQKKKFKIMIDITILSFISIIDIP